MRDNEWFVFIVEPGDDPQRFKVRADKMRAAAEASGMKDTDSLSWNNIYERGFNFRLETAARREMALGKVVKLGDEPHDIEAL